MFTLRNYQAEDQAAVLALDRVVLAELDIHGLPQQFSDLDDVQKQYLGLGGFLVAVVDQQMVGMGGIRFQAGNTARINRMRVHPSCRRQGIARSILQQLELRAVSAGIPRIILNTLAAQESARGFYMANGYVRTGAGSPDGFQVIMYEKQLQIDHYNS